MSPGGRAPLDELGHAIGLLAGRPTTLEERERFRRYLDLLLLWNRTHQMTALRTPRDIVRRLFQDSLLFLGILPSPPLALLDIGAGAGIPGIPLRIVEAELSLTLIEARRKRASFLSTVRRELDLPDIRVIEGRGEHIYTQQPELAGKFDVVVAKAVGPVAEITSIALQYLKPGGRFIASGPPSDREPPALPQDLRAAWQRVEFPSLSIIRLFLVAHKEG